MNKKFVRRQTKIWLSKMAQAQTTEQLQAASDMVSLLHRLERIEGQRKYCVSMDEADCLDLQEQNLRQLIACKLEEEA